MLEIKIKEQINQILSLSNSDRQLDLAIEEMSELIKALLKDRRYETQGTKLNVLEEIADVYNMLDQVKIIYGLSESDIAIIRCEKNERTLERLSK